MLLGFFTFVGLPPRLFNPSFINFNINTFNVPRHGCLSGSLANWLNGQFFWFSLPEARVNTHALQAYAIHMQSICNPEVPEVLEINKFGKCHTTLATLAALATQFSGFSFRYHFVRPFCADLRTSGVAHGRGPTMQQDHVNFHIFPRFQVFVFISILPNLSVRTLGPPAWHMPGPLSCITNKCRVGPTTLSQLV